MRRGGRRVLCLAEGGAEGKVGAVMLGGTVKVEDEVEEDRTQAHSMLVAATSLPLQPQISVPQTVLRNPVKVSDLRRLQVLLLCPLSA